MYQERLDVSDNTFKREMFWVICYFAVQLEMRPLNVASFPWLPSTSMSGAGVPAGRRSLQHRMTRRSKWDWIADSSMRAGPEQWAREAQLGPAQLSLTWDPQDTTKDRNFQMAMSSAYYKKWSDIEVKMNNKMFPARILSGELQQVLIKWEFSEGSMKRLLILGLVALTECLVRIPLRKIKSIRENLQENDRLKDYLEKYPYSLTYKFLDQYQDEGISLEPMRNYLDVSVLGGWSSTAPPRAPDKHWGSSGAEPAD
ncbi:hypothetical protein P7K49_021728 [Saguinus oedipus]|uniref:Aspartic peptidase N-terminal domain-containing protein n=1 Tax=Saguinus oedipus TaxID=9490 RepID=A0ABQ9UUB2_SAGOE|nr:hypothetical protein P7K49_021728 [Saguinus oedipus]